MNIWSCDNCHVETSNSIDAEVYRVYAVETRGYLQNGPMTKDPIKVNKSRDHNSKEPYEFCAVCLSKFFGKMAKIEMEASKA